MNAGRKHINKFCPTPTVCREWGTDVAPARISAVSGGQVRPRVAGAPGPATPGY